MPRLISTWRERSAHIIYHLLNAAKNEGWDEKRIRREIRDAYPFGPREHWPYKVWCDEVRRQRGLPRKPLRSRKKATPAEPPSEQMTLADYVAAPIVEAKDSEFRALLDALGPQFTADLRNTHGYVIREDPDSADFVVVILSKEYPGGLALLMDRSTEDVFNGSDRFQPAD